MPDGTANPKKGRKFDQVIAGARDVFMRDGFEGANRRLKQLIWTHQLTRC